jgi:hypothetical protein
MLTMIEDATSPLTLSLHPTASGGMKDGIAMKGVPTILFVRMTHFKKTLGDLRLSAIREPVLRCRGGTLEARRRAR